MNSLVFLLLFANSNTWNRKLWMEIYECHST